VQPVQRKSRQITHRWKPCRQGRGETGRRKSRSNPAQVFINYLGDCVTQRARLADESATSRCANGCAAVRLVSAVKPQARGSGRSAIRHQPQGEKGRAKRVSRSVSEDERPGVPVSVCHLLGNGDDGETDNAPHRTGRRRSNARPRFRITQRAGAYPLMVRRRESRARSRNNTPGRGWTLQFSGLETLEKARQRIQYRPVCRPGKGQKPNNRAIRGKVFTPESPIPNGRSGSGFSHLLDSVPGVQKFRAWVRDTWAKRTVRFKWQGVRRLRAKETSLGPSAIPSWALRGEISQSSRSRPGRAGITPPGFYGSGNPGKAGQRIQYPATALTRARFLRPSRPDRSHWDS